MAMYDVHRPNLDRLCSLASKKQQVARICMHNTLTHQVRVGNVYRSKSSGTKGWRAGTCYWLVVAVRPESIGSCGGVHMLGLDKDWNIVSTTSYGLHTMQRRQLLYRIKDVSNFALKLTRMER
jgi:hypothetical protein